MKKCCVCKKKIYSWNKFYRKHGSCFLLNKETFKLEKKIYFCSMDCYEKTLDLIKKSSNIFFRYFIRANNDWILLKEPLEEYATTK